ncbi:glycoside hydrolase superfamily [Lasiosphaeria hispida]|uniref:Probable glucan endo-1,3-beta-glucosidase eglC n=1 Tax=Lasiosphaeria hispida TaxID=260671 RepID=A0AAJ0HGS2_9PEZI|nr:glycoside hydrolase superfamily [Lasiosphaeria hispida]
MHRPSHLVALAATFSSALAAFQGFNYGSTFTSGAAKQQSDFEAEFKTAQGLVGAPGGGFTSARLYTTVQGGTANDPISAIPAAINTKTSLLLGIWCSAGDATFASELQALKSAIAKYGTDFTKLVAGISVGSEDLYRISPTGLLNKENPGAQPSTLARYIKEVRDAISGTSLAGAPIGHVDTWTAWVNGSNQAVIDASDWIGVDAYPYFQETQANSVANSKALFDDAVGATQAAVGGKPVWITETGFPVSGKTVGQAIPGLENAKTYWDQVGCPLFGATNTWWYTFQDAAPATPNPSFGIIGNSLTTTPLFDISCKKVTNTTSSTSVGPSASISKSSATNPSTTDRVGGGSPGSDAGSGSGSNGTVPTSSTPSTTPATNFNGAGAISGSVGAAFAAVMVAILAL